MQYHLPEWHDGYNEYETKSRESPEFKRLMDPYIKLLYDVLKKEFHDEKSLFESYVYDLKYSVKTAFGDWGMKGISDPDTRHLVIDSCYWRRYQDIRKQAKKHSKFEIIFARK